jgi:hypothetical protein
MTRAGDHPFGVVAWHFGGFAAGSGRGCGFLHIHQAVTLVFATTGREQHRQALASQRTAAFSPIGGIQHPHLGIVGARAQRGREPAHGFLGKKRPSTAARSSDVIGQKRLPRGMRGSLPSIRSSARCFQDRPAARRIASLTVSGMALLGPRSRRAPAERKPFHSRRPCIPESGP